MSINKKGIDVSYAQGEIDWSKVKDNVDFAIIRAGFGDGDPSFGKDKYLDKNACACEKYGIPFGFYHYSYATSPSEAEIEAKGFLKEILGYIPLYPIYMDFEERAQTELPASEQMDIIEAFLSTLEKAGYYAGLYSFYSAIDYLAKNEGTRLSKYDIWCALWGKKDKLLFPHGMWQYSCNSEIPGIKTFTDCNICYKDYPKIIKRAGLNRT